MHYSAKRGHAIACRLQSESVTLVDQDHIGWKYWKLIAPTISPPTISHTPSLLVAQRPSTYFQGNMGEFWEDWTIDDPK